MSLPASLEKHMCEGRRLVLLPGKDGARRINTSYITNSKPRKNKVSYRTAAQLGRVTSRNRGPLGSLRSWASLGLYKDAFC